MRVRVGDSQGTVTETMIGWGEAPDDDMGISAATHATITVEKIEQATGNGAQVAYSPTEVDSEDELEPGCYYIVREWVVEE